MTSYQHQGILFYSDIIWTSRRFSFCCLFKSLSSYNRGTIRALHYWPFVLGIHWYPMDSPYKGPVIKKMCSSHDIMWWQYAEKGPDIKFMGPTWGPSGADRTQVGPMLAPWTLLSGTSLFTSNTFNSSPPGQNGHHFTNNNCRCIFVKENFCSLIKIAQKFVPKGPVDYNPALIKIMAWRWIGDKPLSEPMLTWFTETYMRQLKHICATVEVWEWIRNFISHFPWYVVTYPCWDQWLWGPSHHWFFLRKFSFSCNSILVSLSFNELITTNFCS